MVRDDGQGIENPQTLLTLGDSDWDPATLRREDPAGAGIWALSSRGAVIRSRACGSETGWRMSLTPDHFSGKTPVTVEPCDMDPGTEITFPEANPEAVHGALQRAARYCPLTVTFEGEPVERNGFLDGAIHVETWNGLRIGIFKHNVWSRDPVINFHGLTLAAPLPRRNEALDGDPFSARIDVLDCPDLKLVLPARKEVVQDAFFEEVKTAVIRTIYRAIAREGAHRLTFTCWQEARKLGVDLPEAVPELRPYVPAVADAGGRLARKPVPVPEQARLVDFDGDPNEQQCLARAMRKSGMELPLFEPCPDYEGYSWYDALSRITGMRCFMIEGSDATEVVLADPSDGDAPAEPEETGRNARPERIEIELTVREPDGSQRTLRLETDVLMAGDSWSSYLDEVRLFATRGSDLTPGQLAELLEAGYFWPSDDAGADSYETQLDRFRDEASHIAIAFLLSREEANLVLLEDGIKRDLLWLIPRDHETVITIHGRDIRIVQRPLAVAEDGEASEVPGNPS